MPASVPAGAGFFMPEIGRIGRIPCIDSTATVKRSNGFDG